jgi:hypothetical protein
MPEGTPDVTELEAQRENSARILPGVFVVIPRKRSRTRFCCRLGRAGMPHSSVDRIPRGCRAGPRFFCRQPSPPCSRPPRSSDDQRGRRRVRHCRGQATRPSTGCSRLNTTSVRPYATMRSDRFRQCRPSSLITRIVKSSGAIEIVGP